MKYEVKAMLKENSVKFIVTVPETINKYQVYLFLLGKYGDDIIIETDSIIEVFEENFTKEN